MAFVREVKRGTKRYYYLVRTYREGGKVKQRTLQYLGTEAPPYNKRIGLVAQTTAQRREREALMGTRMTTAEIEDACLAKLDSCGGLIQWDEIHEVATGTARAASPQQVNNAWLWLASRGQVNIDFLDEGGIQSIRKPVKDHTGRLMDVERSKSLEKRRRAAARYAGLIREVPR